MSRRTAEAHLEALRARFNPHFLFNALTTIGYLVQEAPAEAVRTLLRLTEVLRRVLRFDEKVAPSSRNCGASSAPISGDRGGALGRATHRQLCGVEEGLQGRAGCLRSCCSPWSKTP